MQLLQHSLQLFWDRKPQMRGVLCQGDAFVGQVEEDHCGPQHTAGTDDLRIYHVTDADQREDQHLSTDTLEADLDGELVVGYGA